MYNIFISFMLSVGYMLYVLKESGVIKISKKTVAFYILCGFFILIFAPVLNYFSLWLWIKMGVFDVRY